MRLKTLQNWSAIAVLLLPLAGLGLSSSLEPRPAQAQDGRAMTVRSDIQEADQANGIVTATGNVRIDYPARQMQATAAQAQYFSREQRVVLTGNVYILQEGNSTRAEKVEYFIDSGYVVATPPASRQVESTYILSDPDAPPTTPAPAQGPVYNPKPAFKEPQSNVPQPSGR